MKPKLILMSHGHYAEELYKSAQMIVGPIDGLITIAMLESDGLDGTRKKLADAFSQAGEVDVVIAADLMSGTPCNVAVQSMYERSGVRVLTGLNLPMAIEYAVSDIEDADEMAVMLRDTGAASVRLVEKPQAADGEEGYED
ncbi:PTS IIA component protein [uncultured Eubacteriales bacterium]|uniref:PTS IIA component protein n=1 Tax=uncultured Eubacteriales bacterium TaxID=172733 RepID=A0A212KC21_9FIRM|nr:PTS IIA component protein [uncultured Eubacteriales bacterium]